MSEFRTHLPTTHNYPIYVWPYPPWPPIGKIFSIEYHCVIAFFFANANNIYSSRKYDKTATEKPTDVTLDYFSRSAKRRLCAP